MRAQKPNIGEKQTLIRDEDHYQETLDYDSNYDKYSKINSNTSKYTPYPTSQISSPLNSRDIFHSKNPSSKSYPGNLNESAALSPNTNYNISNSKGKAQATSNYMASPPKQQVGGNYNNYDRFNTFGQSAYDEELIKLKFDEVVSELGIKENLIQEQQEAMKSKNDRIKALEEKNQSLINNLYYFESVKFEYDSLHKRYQDSIKDNEHLAGENSKLIEKLVTKDKINQEFQTLTQMTVNKFKHFEDINTNLTIDNQSLIKELKEIKEKIASITSSDYTAPNKFDIDIEVLKIQDNYQRYFEEQTKKLILKYEKTEDDQRERHKLELKELKEYLAKSNDELIASKKEVLTFKRRLEEQEKYFKDKEFEFKIEFEDKQKEVEGLVGSVKSSQKEIKDINSEFRNKIAEAVSKIRSMEERENRLLIELDAKSKKIEEMKLEILEKINNEKAYDKIIKEKAKRLEELEQLLKQANETNDELRNLIQAKNQEHLVSEEKAKEDVVILLSSLEEMKAENERVSTEAEEIRDKLFEAQGAVNELNNLIEDKYQGLEVMLVKEINQKESLQANLNETLKKNKINEERTQIKMNQIKKNYNSLLEDYENLREKYDSKVQFVSIIYLM